MTRFCPKCKSALVNDSKKKYPRFCRCRKCGYKERYPGTPIVAQNPNFKLVKEPEEVAKQTKRTDALPIEYEKDTNKKYILSKMTEKEKEEFQKRVESIRTWRRQKSKEQLLKKIRQNKYSGLKGQKINIGGELFEV